MWPMRSEMTRDECRKCLRCLELDAYGSMVSVLRAQGPFTNEKQKLLQELAKVLHISNERHRAEIRRAVNDEKLASIAEQLNGPNTGTDWTIEGRRTIPLLPRLKARSVFTTLANSLSLATAAANEKKPAQVASENSIAIETESQPEVKIEKDLLDTKLCNLENDCNNSEILHENSNLAEEEETDDKDMIDKVIEKPKVSKKPEKRKLSPLLSIGPPNKIQVISAPLNNTLCISEDKHTLQTVHKQLIQAIPHTEYAGVISLKPNDENSDTMDTKDIISEDSITRTTVSLNKHVVTSEISMCTNTDWSNLKMLTNTMQNKVSTKVVPAVSSGIALSTPLNKVHSESKDLQHEDNINNTSNNTSERSDNTSSNSCKKRLMASIIHEALVPNSQVQITPVVYPNTTVVAVSSGPGPPQVKQTSTTLMCKKLPPEQIAINHQSTAKTGVTINSKKIVNMSHYPNNKLNAKTNVIVIQKGHAQGVTLSHAGKEVLGKVIMGGKNLCVTSQHNNANSISVQSHHISLNNGDQTKTVLPIINSSQNAESAYKLENISFKQVVDVSANLRHDSNKNKLFSSFQFLERAAKLHVQHKTVIQNMNTVQLKECSNVANTIDRDSPLKTDSAITSTTEEKQHKRNKDASMNCQAIKSLDSSKLQGNKEIFIRPKQIANIPDDASNDIRIENSDEDVEITGDMIDLTNPQHLKYILQEDNYKNCVLEDSRSMATINQLDEHDDS
ncbi:BRCA2-interacting transcriptional repressor EMSY isoform X1 [Camponotus floridanus]|uniref:BRCA2-interacting transcriptional repressor EMSY isoform X1 n=1 Tax=Camponotus floridanus TaxID=104421 RepID=UPI000DC6A7CB|nr:BRCA2-interacting transcriptional repressor EMSY isoform X1 [Camponotus floridanus]